jgi:hypothetical protein
VVADEPWRRSSLQMVVWYDTSEGEATKDLGFPLQREITSVGT